MIALGFDPGSAHVGWTLLQVVGHGGKWLDGGEVNGLDELEALLRRHTGGVTFVAIEKPAGKAHGEGNAAKAAAKSKTLMETSHVAGIVRGFCIAKQIPYEVFSAEEWRSSLIGNPYPSDRDVKLQLGLRIPNLPKNVHGRDAAGGALYAAIRRRLQSMRITP